MNRFLPLFVSILFIGVLSGCSSSSMSSTSPFEPLQNRGIQILSSSSPYHGPNILLSRELEKSTNLSGFFHHHGSPTAIEVKKEMFEDEEIYLYYPREQQVYTTRSVGSKNAEEWIVDGPYRIGKHDYRLLKNHIDNEKQTPVFLVFGSPVRYGSMHSETYADIRGDRQLTQRIEPDVPLIPKPRPKPKPKKVIKKKGDDEEKMAGSTGGMMNSGQVSARLPRLDDPNFIPKNSDQTALLLSKGYAKRAPNGDILHEIEGNAQTLENITHWYMGDVKLLPELQEANNFPESQTTARKGTVVRIPLEFIKNTKQMPMNHRAKQMAPDLKPPMKKEKKEEASG